MSYDPLARFTNPGQQNQPQQPQQYQQQRPPQPPRPAAPQAEDEQEPPRQFDNYNREIYKAFHTAIRKRDRLEIRPILNVWLFPRYFDMEDMTVNGRAGSEIVLMFRLYTVFIKGRNLQQLIYGLKESRCLYIQDYHPQEYAPLTDPSQPIIEQLLIARKPIPGAAAAPELNTKGNFIN